MDEACSQLIIVLHALFEKEAVEKLNKGVSSYFVCVDPQIIIERERMAKESKKDVKGGQKKKRKERYLVV